MSVASIRTPYERHWWANRVLLDTAAALGEPAAAREIGSQFSAPSLKGLLRLWLSRWHAVSPTSVPAEADEAPTLAALRARWDALELLLHHVTDHGTHHRSEVATMLTMVSGSPPGTGLALFCTMQQSQERTA